MFSCWSTWCRTQEQINRQASDARAPAAHRPRRAVPLRTHLGTQASCTAVPLYCRLGGCQRPHRGGIKTSLPRAESHERRRGLCVFFVSFPHFVCGMFQTGNGVLDPSGSICSACALGFAPARALLLATSSQHTAADSRALSVRVRVCLCACACVFVRVRLCVCVFVCLCV